MSGWWVEQPLRREHHTTRLFERQDHIRHSYLQGDWNECPHTFDEYNTAQCESVPQAVKWLERLEASVRRST
jgi:hypothetical protein